MDGIDEETLEMYVEESLEHLSDMENDLLLIEESGANIDEDLVNKVFRAAHSIKGGAGFMGLDNIKELAHKMENVLGMIRSREMVPNPEIMNSLLLASDTLRTLINDVESSNQVDIHEHIESLLAIAAGPNKDDEDKDDGDKKVPEQVCVCFPDGRPAIKVLKDDMERTQEEGKHIYLVEYDLIGDVQQKNKSPMDLIVSFMESGVILECEVDIASAGTLDDEGLPERLPLRVLVGTILKPDMADALFEVDKDMIFEVMEDLSTHPVGGEPQALSEEIPGTDEPPPSAIDHETDKMPEKPTVIRKPAEKKEKGTKAGGGNGMGNHKPSMKAETSIRVHVGILDSLMNLAGELVLGRNQLVQAITHKDEQSIDMASQRLDLITTEMQEAIMATRMQPIGNVFNKFPRVVRDMARKLGKEVDLVLEGKDVELDRTIIEAISDPLTHLVRNSVDHGIEQPDERHAAGKSRTGRVVLSAFHEAGQVNIEIMDDGKGLDGKRIAKTAVKKGLISEDKVEAMSETEKISLIFLPGFSTAEKVTDISGRGVGMDVVKTNLDKLGGHVDIDSTPGKGTTIRIKLPLTLAIIPSQVITAGKERYAIPQVNLEELIRIPAHRIKDKIERIGNAEVVRIRGRLLPLLNLREVLGIEIYYQDDENGREKPDRRRNLADRRSRKTDIHGDQILAPEDNQTEGGAPNDPPAVRGGAALTERNSLDRRYHARSAINIVVVTAGSFRYGLVVDALNDSEEIVVKPLGRHLKHCTGYAGATIMGDGRVALILDVAGLAQMAGLSSSEEANGLPEEEGESQDENREVQSLLLFRNAATEQFAAPLDLVCRILRIKREMIETVGGRKVIQDRGTTLPLVCIEDAAEVGPITDSEDLLAIVFSPGGKEIGLLGVPPVDASEVTAIFDESTFKQPGIMGSAVIDGYTTLLVDIFGLVEAVNPSWFEGDRRPVNKTEERTGAILYAEDSRFFRNQVKGFMVESGYDVIEAEDGLSAWELLQEHADEIKLVVTDIEMPNLDGFGLAEKIKGDDRFSHLHIIALTTLAGEKDMEKGRAVGIDEYQVKLNKEELLQAIYRQLG